MSDNRAHSRFGGSVCARYIACPESPNLCASVPNVSTRYADEGNCAHEVAAISLKRQTHPRELLGETFYDHEVTTEMCDAVVIYLNAVQTEIARSRTAQFFVEQDFVIDVPGCEAGEVHGRNDCIVYHPELKRVRVFDYKHGVGVAVSADDNAQLKFYALGAILQNRWPIGEVILTIVQPRALFADADSAVKDWTFDTVDLLEFQGELEDAIGNVQAMAPMPVENRIYQTGDHCRFCDAAPICPAKERKALAETQLDTLGFTAMSEVTAAALPDPRSFDVARLAKTVQGLEIVTSWLNQCKDLMEGLVLGGHEVPGWKAVEKVARAKWIDDPDQITGYVSMLYDIEPEQLTPRKLVTIAEAERMLKGAGADKAAIDSFKLKFTIKESSGLAVAPASDKRPAVDAARRDFAGVNLAAVAEDLRT